MASITFTGFGNSDIESNRCDTSKNYHDNYDKKRTFMSLKLNATKW